MDDASSERFADLSDSSIGSILVSAGRLSPDDVERIFKEQQKRKLRFGEAAIALGLATEADIQFALSHQFRYPYLQRGESRVSETVVAAYSPFSSQVEALRAVRSQLMRRWFDADNERQALAIVSPDQDEGRSWIAANLAVVFSQLGARALLIDADLRHPSQHNLFGIDNRNGLSSVLSGRATGSVVFRIPALNDLSILPSGPTPPNPQELLARPMLGRMLLQLANSFDVIIIDTPPACKFAESTAIAALAGGALVVSRQNRTRVRHLHDLYAGLRDAGVVITGGVLNGGGTKRPAKHSLPLTPSSEKWWQVKPARLKSGVTALLPPGKPDKKPGMQASRQTKSRTLVK
ncbi:MAG: chain length determinant protein tyrosine kinase EpsG [Azoarcus sp.]|jgi:receptor protein-tyrosine kinase|nr:chain length determinant protein tyrosine kinase EpsG [Azoarcus sp.]